MVGAVRFDDRFHSDRFRWLVSSNVQHHAIHVLRLQQCVQLCQSQRQVLLAVHIGTHSNDAGQWANDPRIHKSLFSVRGRVQCDRCSQSNCAYSRVPFGMVISVEGIQFCHGNFGIIVFNWPIYSFSHCSTHLPAPKVVVNPCLVLEVVWKTSEPHHSSSATGPRERAIILLTN